MQISTAVGEDAVLPWEANRFRYNNLNHEYDFRLQIIETVRLFAISTQSPSPEDEGFHMVQRPEPEDRVIDSESLTAQPTSTEVVEEEPSGGSGFLLFLGIALGCGLLAAGIVYWVEVHRFPVVVAVAPPDGHDQADPLGGKAPLIPLGPDALHVTSISLGEPRLTIANGKRLAEGDWLVVKTVAGEASVRVLTIQDGLVRFKHGGETMDVKLTVIAKQTPAH